MPTISTSIAGSSETAPTGAGKSMALVHLGTEALKEDKTVIPYTLELQDTVIANRYDSKERRKVGSGVGAQIEKYTIRTNG